MEDYTKIEDVKHLSVEDIALLMKAHFEDDARRFEKQQEILCEIRDTLKPISATYTNVRALQKWGMSFLIFISVIAGIVYTVVKTYFTLHSK